MALGEVCLRVEILRTHFFPKWQCRGAGEMDDMTRGQRRLRDYVSYKKEDAELSGHLYFIPLLHFLEEQEAFVMETLGPRERSKWDLYYGEQRRNLLSKIRRNLHKQLSCKSFKRRT